MPKNLFAALLMSHAAAHSSTNPPSESAMAERLVPGAPRTREVAANAVAAILSADRSLLGRLSPESPVPKIAMRRARITRQEPLGMKGIPNRFGEYLGYNQYETILIRENGVKPKTGAKGRPVFNVSLNDSLVGG